MPGNDFTINFSGPVGGRPFSIAVKKERPPNIAPSRGHDRHIDCYLPKSAKIDLTMWPKSWLP